MMASFEHQKARNKPTAETRYASGHIGAYTSVSATALTVAAYISPSGISGGCHSSFFRCCETTNGARMYRLKSAMYL